MEISLLNTKLNIPPPRPVLVSRSRLLERLQEGLGYNLVLISAPAGFGKTTLLSEWTRLNQPEVCTAWLSLDEGDSDPVRFWDYFIAALQTLQPVYGEKILPWLHSSQPPSTESLLNALINELSPVKGDFIIVLDDYHLITSQQIHDGITYLIEHLPAHFHLVIASRADPPLPLARLRGKGMMLEIHTDDLRFIQEETAILLKELKTPTLTTNEIDALDERTEGWVLGLKMAALSMKGQKDIPGFIAAFTGSQRYIMDYLMEEVLQKQSQEIRDFLMRTSILERLNGPLCGAITGRKDSQRVLLNLERDHLFIVPLDESRQWYRYEHLFADLVRQQCEITYGAEQVAALHRQASQWYEDNALPDEAVNHALKAKDWQMSIRLIYTHGETKRKLGERNILLSWLKTIPDERLLQHFHLYSQYAALLAEMGHLDEAEAALYYLETVAESDTVLQGEIAFSWGIVYERRGDMKRYLEFSEKAFTLLPQDNVPMRCRAAINIAHARLRLGPLDEVEKWAMEAFELGQQTADIWNATKALGLIGNAAGYQGKFKRAAEMYRKAIEFGWQATSPFGPHNMLCMVEYFLNDLEAASEDARLSVKKAELRGDMSGAMLALFYQAKMCLARGDSDGAAAAMERMDKASGDVSTDLAWSANYVANHIIYAILLGNLEDAGKWSEQLPHLEDMMLLDQPVSARLLLAQSKRESAVRLLQKLYEKVIQFGATAIAIIVRTYQSLGADNEEQALEFLAEALTLAAPEGIIRVFVDEGRLLKPLLEKALSGEITPGFTRKLLDIIEEEERQRQARKRATAPLPLPGPLSQRELDVLRLLADDIPNQHIAEKLNISLGTVKTHVHHIIDKLEVKDRRQAVQRAKELKLI